MTVEADTTPTPPEGTGTGNTSPAPPPAGTEQENSAKLLTQTEVDAIVADRLARDRRTNNIDQLQADSAELARIRTEQQTDDEKAWNNLAEIVTQRDNALAAARDTAIRSAVESAAVTAGAVSPAQVFALVNRDDIAIDDNGAVTGATEAVTAFIAANPHFVGTGNGAPQTPGRVNGGANTPPPKTDIHAQIAEAEAAADWATSRRLKNQLLSQAVTS